MPVRVENREDPDKTYSSDLSGSVLFFWAFLAGN